MSIFYPKETMHAEDFECYPNQDFRNAQSLILEIGPGRGDFLFELGEQNLQSSVVAIEYKKKRYSKLIERISKRGLKNVSLVWGNARLAVPELFQDEQLQEVYILHPDPWPKKRHAKHRLIQKEFLEILAQKIKRGGFLQIQTDDKPYAEWIREAISSGLSRWIEHPSRPRHQRIIKTLFEQKMAHKEHFTFNLERC